MYTRFGTNIKSFKELLTVNTNCDEYFYLNHVSTFVLKVQSLIDEVIKKQSLPSIPRIKKN